MTREEKIENAMLDMILDLDRHFPSENYTQEYYQWFYHRYIEPIVTAFNSEE